MRTTKALAGVALALTALLTVTACGTTSTGGSGAQAAGNGIADRSADEILAAAEKAALAQGSVHIVGTVTQGSGDMGLDLQVEKGGKAVGSVTMSGATLQIISTGTTVYAQGDRAFWDAQAGAGAAELIGDKWVVSTAGSDLSDFASFTNFDTFVAQLLKPSGTVTKGEASTVDGTPAIGLKDGDKGTLWIATTGDPLPLWIDGGAEGSLKFSDWGTTVTITEPAAADVLDPSQLGQ